LLQLLKPIHPGAHAPKQEETTAVRSLSTATEELLLTAAREKPDQQPRANQNK